MLNKAYVSQITGELIEGTILDVIRCALSDFRGYHFINWKWKVIEI